MILQDFSSHIMETVRRCSTLHGYCLVVMLLATSSGGASCEAPSSPQCFRRNADDDMYTCQWSMNTTGSVTFDLVFRLIRRDLKTFRNIKNTWIELHGDDGLIIDHPVNIYVEAHVGDSICVSNWSSAVLAETVKYDAPQIIYVSWMKNHLSLRWKAAEKHPALAEVLFRHVGDHKDSWEKTTANTTNESAMCQVTVLNLLKNSVYEVKVRHQSTRARNPLWSDWSPVVTVPAELEEKPKVTNTTVIGNGTRKVMLTWKPMSNASAFTGVNYSVMDTQSCPCVKKGSKSIRQKHYTTYVSYSAVNISVYARNGAGLSPPAVIELSVPAEATASLKACNPTMLETKLKNKTCFELYKLHSNLQYGDLKPTNVITVSKKKGRKQILKNITDYVRYLYLENKCDRGKPKTVEMCLYYKKEGVPRKEPQDFIAYGETHNSADLSWKAIPFADQQGFLTNYSLCSVKINNAQDEPQECHNISASLTKYRLENLTQATKYSISLAGVTRKGAGPKATVIVNTFPEKHVHESVFWTLGLMIVFFLMSTTCPCILKGIKNKIFPPVPRPVIQHFTSNPIESQEILERKEVLHELTLHQLQPEGKSVPEDTEKTSFCSGQSDEDADNRVGHSTGSGGSSDGSCSSTDQPMSSSREVETTDMEQEDNEIAMLIYRNRLVFDVKTDSP